MEVAFFAIHRIALVPFAFPLATHPRLHQTTCDITAIARGYVHGAVLIAPAALPETMGELSIGPHFANRPIRGGRQLKVGDEAPALQSFFQIGVNAHVQRSEPQ